MGRRRTAANNANSRERATPQFSPIGRLSVLAEESSTTSPFRANFRVADQPGVIAERPDLRIPGTPTTGGRALRRTHAAWAFNSLLSFLQVQSTERGLAAERRIERKARQRRHRQQ